MTEDNGRGERGETITPLSAPCPYLIEFERSEYRRQSNALRTEPVIICSGRCSLKLPEHWPQAAKDRGALRWVASGGSPLVFGRCCQPCPRAEVEPMPGEKILQVDVMETSLEEEREFLRDEGGRGKPCLPASERVQTVQILASEEKDYSSRCKPVGKRIFSDSDITAMYTQSLIIGAAFNQAGYSEITVYKKRIQEIKKIGRPAGQASLFNF